jgi:hypothetical protein
MEDLAVMLDVHSERIFWDRVLAHGGIACLGVPSRRWPASAAR